MKDDWYVSYGPYGYVYVRTRQDNSIIATVEDVEDVRLLAAAPAMLRALKSLQRVVIEAIEKAEEYDDNNVQ